MIAPEKWRSDELLACAENVARRSLPLPFRHDPVLHTNAACARIGPPRDIAGGKDSRDIRFQKFVYQYAVVGRDSCCFSKRSVRTYADSNDDEIAIQYRSVIQLYLSVLYNCWRSPEMKLYSVLLVSFANQLTQFASENLFERQRPFPDHCDFKLALAQRCRHFQPDEARADDNGPLRVFGFRNDVPAVSESSQITNVRQIVPRNLKPHRLSTGCQQQRAVR